MTLDLMPFWEYIDENENGFTIRDDCPKNIRDKLMKINEEYKKCMGELLFVE